GFLAASTQLRQPLDGSPAMPPGYVEKLEEDKRRYRDRELTGFELGPKRGGRRVVRLEDPPPEDRCVEDELPQRVSRILLMATVTSKPARGGFRLTRRSMFGSALRTRA